MLLLFKKKAEMSHGQLSSEKNKKPDHGEDGGDLTGKRGKTGGGVLRMLLYGLLRNRKSVALKPQ